MVKFSSSRKANGGSTRTFDSHHHGLYAFLTTEANGVVMPVILTSDEDCLAWLNGGEGSMRLQGPLADDLLKVVDGPE